MVEGRLRVINRLGLHARAAAKLVHLASVFACDIALVFDDGEEIDAKSILGILGRGAAQGTELLVRCRGADAGPAFSALEALFASRFGEGE